MRENDSSRFRMYNPNQNEEIRKRDMFGKVDGNEMKGKVAAVTLSQNGSLDGVACGDTVLIYLHIGR